MRLPCSNTIAWRVRTMTSNVRSLTIRAFLLFVLCLSLTGVSTTNAAPNITAQVHNAQLQRILLSGLPVAYAHEVPASLGRFITTSVKTVRSPLHACGFVPHNCYNVTTVSLRRGRFLTHRRPSQQWARTRAGERMRSGRPASWATRATTMTAV